MQSLSHTPVHPASARFSAFLSRIMIVLSLVVIVGAMVVHASVDHDGWEFYGGQKRRLKHGLNRATADAAPRDNDQVRFDKLDLESEPELRVTNDEAPAAPVISSSPSRITSERIKSKEELLLLPDRYSVLSFDLDEEVSESSWWGRLYIDGFPNSIQYFRAHFGYPPPDPAVRLVLASPLNMCDEVTGLPVLNNVDEINDRTIVVAMRGKCTFGEKALVAYGIRAAGILFVNNQEGLMHPAGPEARDIQMSAFMITQHDGDQLIQALRRVAKATDPEYSLKGQFVPIMCKNISDSENYCKPIDWDGQIFESSLDYKGKLYAKDDVEFDYMQGEFGSWIDSLAEWNTLVPTVIGGDAHCCDKAGFESSRVSKNTAMLCKRGECDFVSKAENAAAAGAGMVIVSSYNSTLNRMGCDPPLRGRKVHVATMMVSYDAYEEMSSKFFTQLDAGSASSVRLNKKNWYRDNEL